MIAELLIIFMNVFSFKHILYRVAQRGDYCICRCEMSRLPSVKASDVDVCSLAASVAELRGPVTEIMSTLKSLVDARLYTQVQNLTDSIRHIRAQMAEVISSTTQQVVITQEKGNNHNPVDVGSLPCINCCHSCDG